MAINTPLYQHQQRGYELAHDKTYFALLYEPGLGKTLTAAAIIDDRVARFSGYRTLYVAPNALVENVAADIAKHTSLRCVQLTGSRDRRLKMLAEKADIYIINYEGARVITHDLERAKFQLLVCDESHACKSPTSLQSKACFTLAHSIPHKLILTGTPILNSPLDIFGQYRLLHPGIFGLSWYRFRARYAILGGYMNKQVVKYINMQELRRKVESCAHICTKAECLDLPDKNYQTVYLDLPTPQRKAYKQMADNFIAEIKNTVTTAPIILTRLMRFSQITAGFWKDVEDKEHAFDSNPKVDWLVEWCRDNQQKVVVFCRFIHEIVGIENALRNAGISFRTIRGGVEPLPLVDEFNNNPSVQVLVGQLQVAGQGFTLTAAAYAIFMSNDYSYGRRLQAEDRIHRISQTRNCTYIDVCYRDTIDVRLLSVLQKKQSLAELIMGGTAVETFI